MGVVVLSNTRESNLATCDLPCVTRCGLQTVALQGESPRYQSLVHVHPHTLPSFMYSSTMYTPTMRISTMCTSTVDMKDRDGRKMCSWERKT